MTDKDRNQSFILHEQFTLAHFDLSHSEKPRGFRQDLVTIENAIHRVATHAYSKQCDPKVKELALAFLTAATTTCRECLAAVSVVADQINAAYQLDPVVGELPDGAGTTCSLRWNDERVWILVRTLLRIDTGHRQLRRLRERGAIDHASFRKQREPLVQPFRVAAAAILRLAAALPDEAKGVT